MKKNKQDGFSAWDFPARHPGRLLQSYINAWGTRENVTLGTTERFADVSEIPLESLKNILDEKEMPSTGEMVQISKALGMKVETWEHFCEDYTAKKAGLPQPGLVPSKSSRGRHRTSPPVL